MASIPLLYRRINKSGAWALGISINSLGKSHHIIQIVQSPMVVIKTIDVIWNQSNNEECLICINHPPIISQGRWGKGFFALNNNTFGF